MRTEAGGWGVGGVRAGWGTEDAGGLSWGCVMGPPTQRRGKKEKVLLYVPASSVIWSGQGHCCGALGDN